MIQKLSVRILLPTVVIAGAVISTFGWMLDRTLERQIQDRAKEQVDVEIGRALDNLHMVDMLSGDETLSAMRVLWRESERLGRPSVEAAAPNASLPSLPMLRMGQAVATGDFTIVDQVKTLTGATATLFVKRDDNFVRVSTNVLREDGTRALGTELDHSGPAYAAITEGHAFHGVVEILAKPYMTAYEPMRDEKGSIIGVWYVGFPLRMLSGMGAFISNATILDHGFLAVQKANGKAMFKPATLTDDMLTDKLAHGREQGWAVLSRRFDPWGYAVIAAYPESDIQSRLKNVRWLVIGCGLITCILLVLAKYWLVEGLISKPLRLLVQRMEGADLNTFLVVDRKDEVGVLAKAFDQFVTRVREAMSEVALSSSAVATASEQISCGARQVANGVSVQKQQVEEIAEVLQGMSSEVQEVSSHCATTSTMANKSAEAARGGGTLVKQSLEHMQTIADAVVEASVRVEDLRDQSKRIGKIAELIDDIARQTELLALNAAIEAARAGEHGKGFAVVATEVRALAERTTQATKEIAGVVETVQAGTGAAVACIRTSADEVALGVAITGQAGTSLGEIVEDVERLGTMSAKIAGSARQQASATSQVYEKIEQINRFAAESATGARESAHACEQLTTLALRMQDLVARFQVGGAIATAQPSRQAGASAAGLTPVAAAF